MSASSTKVTAAALAVVVLMLAGVFGWRQVMPAAEAPAPLVASTSVRADGAGTPAEGAPAPAPALSERVASTPANPNASEPARRVARAPAAPTTSAPADTGSRARAEPVAGAPFGDPTGTGEPKPSIGGAAIPNIVAAAPSFDIVRVEPSGDALLAGRSKPNAPVALVAGGKVVAQTRADSGGNFVMTPPPLKPGDYSLGLREGEGAAARESTQSVVVSVPASKKQPVVVAVAEPGQPTHLLSAPPEAESARAASGALPAAPVPAKAAPQAAAIAVPKLAIRSVELENGSGLFASGFAPPGSDVRIYLNNSRVADVIAAAAGAWTLTVRKGLSAGRYAVRADSLKPDESVAARVEVPFEVPSPMAAEANTHTAEPAATSAPAAKVTDAGTGTPRPLAPASTIPKFSPADVVVDEVRTELVTRGDNLWAISRKRFGHGIRYTEIYAANAGQIRNPNVVYPGQVFVMPRQ